MESRMEFILRHYKKGSTTTEEAERQILALFSVSGTLPDFECRCKELNAINRICQKCSGIVPIRL